MSQPFDALTPAERGLYDALRGEPLAQYLPSILADHADDNGQEYRAQLLRQDPRAALYELLRNRALTDEECAQVVREPAGDTVRRVSALLGTPQHEGEPRLLDDQGNLDVQHLHEQYDFQVALLASLDLLEDRKGHLGITGIDGRFHPLPVMPQIEAALTTKRLHRKLRQGFNQLLLVPFALPLKRLLGAWGENLLRNEHLLQPYGGLNREEPVCVPEGDFGLHHGQGPDEDGCLVYFPERFEQDHGGRTKADLLAAAPATGWDVLLVEGGLPNILRPGEGQTVGGRAQIEAGRSPQEDLASLPGGEAGWTPEIYIAAFLTSLERSGQALDTKTVTYLLGSYIPAPACVPGAGWFPEGRQAALDGVLGDSGPNIGARAAVRVV